jgi:hypothetical protein
MAGSRRNRGTLIATVGAAGMVQLPTAAIVVARVGGLNYRGGGAGATAQGPLNRSPGWPAAQL